MQKFVQTLIAESGKVATSILDLGLVGELHPMKVFALVCYTMDLGSFGAKEEDNFYFQLNKALQKRDPNTMAQLSGYLHFFLGAFRDLPKQPEALYFRGVAGKALQHLRHYELGRCVTWSGVTSTSRDEGLALDFARGGGVVFRVRAKSGVAVDKFSVFNEKEVLLAPNFRAMVSRSAYQEPAHPGITFVDLAEVSGADTYVF